MTHTLCTADPERPSRSRKLPPQFSTLRGQLWDCWSQHNCTTIKGNEHTRCRHKDLGPGHPDQLRQCQDFERGIAGKDPMPLFPVRPGLATGVIKRLPEIFGLPENPIFQICGHWILATQIFKLVRQLASCPAGRHGPCIPNLRPDCHLASHASTHSADE